MNGGSRGRPGGDPPEAAILRAGWRDVVFRLLGFSVRGLSLAEKGVTVHSARPVAIPFEGIAGDLSVRTRLGVRSLLLPRRRSRRPLAVVGVRAGDAARFARAANEARREYYRRAVEAEAGEIAALSDAALRLEDPRRYPAACLLEPYVRRARELMSRLPGDIPAGFIDEERRRQIGRARILAESPVQARRKAVGIFVDNEQARMARFFDRIASRPLTPEQRRAVVTDEDATLVLAGAGSGKTSVIAAKARCLIERNARRPGEILLVTFTKSAAKEMAGRINAPGREPVEVTTFHALGNRILGQVEGTSPALAPHAEDAPRLHRLLKDMLLGDAAGTPKRARLLRTYFSEFFYPYKNEWDFKTMDEYYQYVNSCEPRSLKGERVRSFEELHIANWLFTNGIEYDHEPVYERPLPAKGRRAYAPDFRLKQSGVYIEHFGVRREIDAKGEEIWTTAPGVDRDEYLEGMEWKRRVHRENGTTLIETYSQDQTEGRLTEALAERIAPFAAPRPIPDEEMLKSLSEQGQVDRFTETLSTFLRHFKNTSATVAACREMRRGLPDASRSAAFLDIFEPVFERYQRSLGERIDFEDMILRAAGHVEAGRYRSPYRHLLVDEFQDISAGQARLLTALKRQHEDARVFAVGDDWQSIFRFSGSDLHLMRGFGRHFGGEFAGETGVHETVELGRTFRSVDRIALPARRFILRNPAQIPKRVVPAGSSRTAAIRIARHAKNRGGRALDAALRRIGKTAGGGRSSVFLLGRYRHVCPKDLDSVRRAHPGLAIRFLTVHASKGLEADHVIILQACAGRMGFPSEIVDDPILDLVLPEAERFSHAEERRLFYVALTRARRSVTVLADADQASAFARELEDDEEYGVAATETAGAAGHACRLCGGRMRMKTSQAGNPYFKCENAPLCDGFSKTCAACKRDRPVADGSDPSKLRCGCGETYPACPECKDGWLVERSGQFGGFLGCVRYGDFGCPGKMNPGKRPRP